MLDLLFVLMTLIVSVLPFAMVTLIVIIIVKSVKRHSNESSNGTFKNTISNANDPNSYGNSISSEPINITCEYCGTVYSKIKKSCPSCGVKTNKK